MLTQAPASSPSSDRATRESRGLIAIVFLAVLAAYFPALNGGMLWDDAAHVTAPALRTFEGLRRIWFEVGATQQYYPVLHTAFWLEHRLWGDAVLGYHLVNLLWHATAACLLARVIRRLALPGAWLAALVFALHPVCVESVAWISEQKNTLSAVLYLTAALVYLRFDRERRAGQYWLATTLFLLALLTKTVTATLPAALLVVIWWQRGRLEGKSDLRPLLPWLAAGMIAGLFTAWVERTLIGAEGEDFGLSVVERGLLAGRVLWFYLGKIVWPADLVFIYPRWTVSSEAVWQYLFPLAAVGALAGLALLARKRRGPLAGFLIFAGTLFPALGFVDVFPFIYSYVADHFQYLASVGIIVPVSAGLEMAARSWPRGVRRAGLGVVALGLGVLTWRQCGMYRDVETLYRETLARNPGASMAHNNLGEILARDPAKEAEARKHYEAALEANPRNYQAHNNLGLLLAKKQETVLAAVAHYEAALKIAPGFPEAHNNLGMALSQITGREAEVLAHYETAVRLAPDSAGMHDNLGAALVRVPERLAEAIGHFETAVRLDPNDARLRNHLGVALANIPGKLGEAETEFEAAVRLDPRSAEAHHNLGKVLSLQPDKTAEAPRHFAEAVRLQPDFAEAQASLGKSLLGIEGREQEALTHLEESVRLDPRSADARNNLGAALLNFPTRRAEAIEQFHAALALDPRLVEAHFALGVVRSTEPEGRAEAIAQLEEALRLNPEFAPAREWLERLKR